MSDAKSPPDLSIDEILATIRRIITEDEEAGAPSSGSGVGTGAAVEGITGSAAAGGLGGGVADDKAGDSDDVLELTEAINEDGSTRHLAPIGSSSRRAAAILEPPPAASRSEPEPEPRHREAPSLPPAPGQAATANERLISDVASFAAAAAFARVAAAPRAPSAELELPLGAGDRTLEDLVRDLLRPLLQTWLEENLPELVERLVQAEIARVVGKSGVAGGRRSARPPSGAGAG